MHAKAAHNPSSSCTNAVELKHSVIPEAVDPAYLNELFPRIKAVFKPQAVKYRCGGSIWSNTAHCNARYN